MIYSLRGRVAVKASTFFVVEVGGIGFKVSASPTTLKSLPDLGRETNIFCRVCVREDEIELYGFLGEKELEVFGLLNLVSGVGPKSALAVMGVTKIEELMAAIKENRPDVLARASGIGKKTAERIVLELKDKTWTGDSSQMIKKMESDADIVEVLIGLGYRRERVKEVLAGISKETTGLEDRLKTALRTLGGKGN